MIKVGTDLMRAHIDDKIWIKSVLNGLNASNSDIKVVTDVRYKNEAEAIRNAGGVLFYIHRENNPHVDLAASHSSETEIDENNCCELGFIKVFNSSTLEDYHNTISLIFQDIRRAIEDGKNLWLPARGHHYQLPVKIIPISSLMGMIATEVFGGVSVNPKNPSAVIVTLRESEKINLLTQEERQVMVDMFGEIYRRLISNYMFENITPQLMSKMTHEAEEILATFVSHGKYGIYNYQ
jgi:hypothetical protein